MDVPPCNSLLDLRFFALVLSRTLNGSPEGKKNNPKFLEFQGPVDFSPAFSLFRYFD
jgi:hypothetical protein